MRFSIPAEGQNQRAASPPLPAHNDVSDALVSAVNPGLEIIFCHLVWPSSLKLIARRNRFEVAPHLSRFAVATVDSDDFDAPGYRF
jgi:hypothetical protein